MTDDTKKPMPERVFANDFMKVEDVKAFFEEKKLDPWHGAVVVLEDGTEMLAKDYEAMLDAEDEA